LRTGLQALGWIDGQNVSIEYRYGAWSLQRLVTGAQELSRRPVDVILAGDSLSVHAAKQATNTIPIVMAISGDPVSEGLVPSLERPGGNITGLTNHSRTLAAKRLQLLREVIPDASSVAVLRNADSPSATLQWQEVQKAAQVLGLDLQSLEVRRPEDFEGAFQAARAEALMVLTDPLTTHHRKWIVDFARNRGLPTMHGVKEAVDLGGLMSYGADRTFLMRRAASYIDQILKGANPAAMAIEGPTLYDLAVSPTREDLLGFSLAPHVGRGADGVADVAGGPTPQAGAPAVALKECN